VRLTGVEPGTTHPTEAGVGPGSCQFLAGQGSRATQRVSPSLADAGKLWRIRAGSRGIKAIESA
jgi:hypothetical protein